jgi:hypothetical protein
MGRLATELHPSLEALPIPFIVLWNCETIDYAAMPDRELRRLRHLDGDILDPLLSK